MSEHPSIDGDGILDAVDLLPPASEQHGNAASDLSRATARRASAVRLRLAGATYEQIAQRLGYGDKSTARKAVIAALSNIEVESVQELRVLENARLDADELVLRGIIGDRTQPAAVRIKAIDSRRHLSARRSRLNGLDAPVQVALSSGAEARLADVLSEASALVMGLTGPDGTVVITDAPETPGAAG